MGPVTYNDLPIGMRFRPSDLEMAVYFLYKRAFGLQMNARIVPDNCHDIFSRHPHDLPEYEKEDEHWYFYREKSKSPTKSYNLWIPTGEETEVLDPKKNDKLVGIKHSFAFIENEEEESEKNGLPDEEETPKYNWYLDEISLPLTVTDTDWTMCHVYCKNTKPEFVSLPVVPYESESESESDQSEGEEEEEEEKEESVEKPAETLNLVKEKKDETVLLPPPPASP
ncbi:PREDICTED: NAC domain-containing protein 104 [Camelina sativa]|uniref:NAC domain-containing protein 104 n=1 Tax=Camelina sativa TaxID=90675 RepID=A0ABM0U5B8_CAMSA|nr:PREDICTED: NAC domain-containing protein 104 [Camelina sativa]